MKRKPQIAQKYSKKRVRKVQIPLFIKPSLAKVVTEMAQSEGRNRTNFIEMMIRQFAEANEFYIDESLDYEQTKNTFPIPNPKKNEQ